MVKELFPFKENYYDLDGISMHYLDEGEGEPVLMLHGNPTWSFYYRDLVQDLSKDHRCIVPDHIGCGLSEKPSDKTYTYTLDRRVSDVEKLVKHLGIEKGITLVVHDWGGMIGSVFAVRNPEKIARIVILNTGGFLLPETKKFPLALRFCRNRLLGPLLVRGFNLFCIAASRVCAKKPPLNAGLRAAYISPYDSWKNRIAILRFVQDIPLVPSDPSYDTVRRTGNRIESLKDKPVLICWGMKDFVFDIHFLEEWIQRLPDAEVHRFEDCGHYILEDGGDEVRDFIRNFITVSERKSPIKTDQSDRSDQTDHQE